jgi:GH24 family phage-related lysozyme (muramidase)
MLSEKQSVAKPGSDHAGMVNSSLRETGNGQFSLLRSIRDPRVSSLSRSGFLQPKLAISRPDDPYEQEADRVAERVMRMPEPAVQRKGTCPFAKGQDCRDDDEKTREDLVQRKVSAQPGWTSEAPPIVHEVLQSPGKPLDADTRVFFEPRFGYDFGNVRVHSDARAAESARAVSARAFTVGNRIVFGNGAYNPGIDRGRQLLAHELAHTVQQVPVTGTGPLSGFPAQFPVIRRKIICEDEEGYNCHSEYDPNEDQPKPASPPSESAPARCTPGEMVPEEGGRRICDKQGFWKTIRNPQASPQAATPKPRALTHTVNPSMISEAELELEIYEIHEFLRGNPESGPDRQRLEEMVAALEAAAQQRRQDSANPQKPLDLEMQKRIDEIRKWLKTHPGEWKYFDKPKEETALTKLEGPAPPKCPPPSGTGSHPLSVSPKAIVKMKARETYMSSPYPARVGEDVCTIGYGHQMRRDQAKPFCKYCSAIIIKSGKTWKEATKTERNEVKSTADLKCGCTMSCDPALAEELLIADKAIQINEVKDKLKSHNLTPDEFDAFVDICLSVGHFPTDLLDAVNSYWCTNAGKNYVRAFYMTTALKTERSGKSEFSEYTKGFIDRRQKQAYEEVPEKTDEQDK